MRAIDAIVTEGPAEPSRARSIRTARDLMRTHCPFLLKSGARRPDAISAAHYHGNAAANVCARRGPGQWRPIGIRRRTRASVSRPSPPRDFETHTRWHARDGDVLVPFHLFLYSGNYAATNCYERKNILSAMFSDRERPGPSVPGETVWRTPLLLLTRAVLFATYYDIVSWSGTDHAVRNIGYTPY